MVEKIGVRKIYTNTSFVYKIHLKDTSVFMRIDRTRDCNSERYVVIVDAIKVFEDLKKDDNTWDDIHNVQDEAKYADTCACFSKGEAEPVQLAEVSYPNKISIDGGTTRTQWLIRNGAVCFPVECMSEETAKALHRQFGYEHTTIENVSTLIGHA